MADGPRLRLFKTARFFVFQHYFGEPRNEFKLQTNETACSKEVAQDRDGRDSTAAPPSSRFPPTTKAYMFDTYTMASEAKFLGVVEDDAQGPAILLDETIFHPQGGGQPSDEGTITCGSITVKIRTVRDFSGVIHHFCEAVSGSSSLLKPGQPVSLALDSAKRLRHAALHSAGHAVDKAIVEAVGTGIFSPLKGYHFEDSPYVEYKGALPGHMDKETFIERVNRELDKIVTADVATTVQFVPGEHGASAAPSSGEGGTGATGGGGGGGGRAGGGKNGMATRIVAVAGLSCPCGGTHVRSTKELQGVRVTKIKAKKGTLRVSYSLVSPSS